MIKLFILLILVSIVNCKVNAQLTSFTSQQYQSHRFNDGILLVYCDNSIIEIQAYTPDIIWIAFNDDFNIKLDSSVTVIAKPSNIKINCQEFSDHLEYSTDSISLHISKNPISLKFYKDGKIFLEDTSGGFYKFAQYNSEGINFRLTEKSSLYGEGSRALPINRRNEGVTFANMNRYGYGFGTDMSLNVNVPFVMSSDGWGLFFDIYTGSILNADYIEAQKNILSYCSLGHKFNFFVIHGNSYSDILSGYTYLTGRYSLPPRWLLGYLQSRAVYHSRDELERNVFEMQKENFPIDAVVFDLSWFKNMGDLTWDSVFSQPIDMISEFKNMGINFILISEIFVSLKSINAQQVIDNKIYMTDTAGTKPYYVNVMGMPGYLILDLTNPKTLDWLWSKCKTRTDEGIAGWWCDGGEPEEESMYSTCYNGQKMYDVHNIYGSLWLEGFYNHFRKDYPNRRPVFLARAGWAGVQRYGAYHLCGDEGRTFNSLKAMVPVMLGSAMSGIGYLHSDAGGFAWSDYNRNDVLYTRWLQLGAFSPILRAHCLDPIPSEPIWYSDSAKTIIRDIVNLRYELLPYNYTLSYICSTTGIPMMRPINFYEMKNTILSDINDEFLWGENFLAAPVVDSVFKRDVSFPQGNWIDYFKGDIYRGDTTFAFDVPLSRFLLFVKSGSIFPMTNKMMNTTNYNADTLTIKYYPDTTLAESSYTMYNDDGKSFNSIESGDFELLHFNGVAKSTSININISKSGLGFSSAPKDRDMTFKIYKLPFVPGTCIINGQHIKIVHSFSDYSQIGKSAIYISETNEFWIHFNWNNDSTSIDITQEVDTIQEQKIIPPNLTISKVYPNPFHKYFNVGFYLDRSTKLNFELYNVAGESIESQQVGYNIPGYFEFECPANNKIRDELAPGAYFLKIQDEKNNQSKYLILIKE